jgi:hypothetical protein
MVAGIGGAGHDGAGCGANRIIVRHARTAVTDFQPIGEGPLVARVGGRRAGGALLHAAFFRAAIVIGRPIDDVKEGVLALVEHHFKVGRAASANISRAPFNVKLPVGRRARDRSENAAAAGKIRAAGR